MNSLSGLPWNLSFSYGRALQEPCLDAWSKNISDFSKAQQLLYKRSKLNSDAAMGQYTEALEKETV